MENGWKMGDGKRIHHPCVLLGSRGEVAKRPFRERLSPTSGQSGCGWLNFRVARDSIRIVKAPRSGPSQSGPASAAAMLISVCRQRAERNVISVRISERELLRSSVRIEVWFLFEPTDERACPLKRQVEIIDTEEQQEAVAGCPVIGAHQ